MAVFGALSDRVGRKPLMIGFGLLGMIEDVFQRVRRAPRPNPRPCAPVPWRRAAAAAR